MSESTAAVWIVLQDEIHEGLPDDHANLCGLARIRTSVPAGTLVDRYIGRPFQHQIPGCAIGDDLLQLNMEYVPVQYDDGVGRCFVILQRSRCLKCKVEIDRAISSLGDHWM